MAKKIFISKVNRKCGYSVLRLDNTMSERIPKVQNRLLFGNFPGRISGGFDGQFSFDFNKFIKSLPDAGDKVSPFSSGVFAIFIQAFPDSLMRLGIV